MRRRRRFAAAALLLAGAAVATILLLGSGSQSPPSGSGKLGPGRTTSVVTRRTLTESSTVEGTLGYGTKVDLYNRLAGTFTWLPKVGTVVRRGETLWRIDNRPVALMYGPVPAYRTLKVGVGDGPDVAELNRNLIALGFDPYGEIDEDAHFGAATVAAVRRWQEAEHLPKTGEVELGRIVFAKGARRVTALEVTVGQDPPPAPPSTEEVAAEEAAAAEQAAEEEQKKEEEAEEDEKKEEEEKRQREARNKEEREAQREEREEEEEAKERPDPGQPAAEEAGGRGTEQPPAEAPAAEEKGPEITPQAAAAEVALTTTSTRQIVQVHLSAAEQGLAHVGKPVPVTLPDGKVVKGHITEVGTVAETPAGGGPEGGEEGGGESTISVTVALDHPVARLDQAPVSVELVARVSPHVLAVSATALFATAGGRYAVEALKGGRQVEMPVTPGMFADGYVQVEGPGLHPGLKVVEPSE
jgi:peptidoglycan hydrolase-like protein with peptidoglycan-binding domain